ncbi:MAG: DUF721 domain-containing protein [Nitrospinota bacterium]|nr:DUF721 domain-containing protein [Nitrospinota bacterium]
MAKFRFSKFRKMEEIFNSLGRKETWANRLSFSDIMLVWQKVVGPDISKIAKPTFLRGKKIIVEVSENVWLLQLQSESQELIEKLNLNLKNKKLNEIKFVLSNQSINFSLSAKGKNEVSEEYEPFPISRKDEEKASRLVEENDDKEFKEMAEKLLSKIKKA